jgi:APA family basic amino acid/polyamine antiporter
VENPRRNIPLTIAFGLGIVMSVYIGIGWLVAGSLSVEELKTSKVALLDAAMRHLPSPWVRHYLNVAALFAGLTSINAVFLAVPREFAALAEEGILPKWVMRYNERRQTFPAGIGITAAVGCVLVLPGLNPDIYGLLCVAGLMLANAIFSVGAMRLTRLYPEQVAAAPLKIRDTWLKPAAVISALLSIAFGALAVFFYWPVAVVLGLFAAAGFILGRRAGAVPPG